MHKSVVPLLLAGSFALSGCVAGIAASAIGAAVRSSQARDQGSNEFLLQPASEACRAHAARYGAVTIIDVERRSSRKIIVWGAVDDGKERRSFECSFANDRKITDFKLRPISPVRG